MRAVLASLMLIAAAEPAAAQISYFGRLPEQKAEILPGELFATPFAGGIPLLGYDASWEWMALVCRTHCELLPVHLKMTEVKIHPYGEQEPIPGQKLALDRELDAQPLVVMHGLPGKSVQHPTTWLHGAMREYPRGAARGSMEFEIPGTDGPQARIVPRMTRGNSNGPVSFNVYLETKSRSQLLGNMPMDVVTGPASLARGTRLLRWAGDLDGDDKLDLVMNFSSRDGEETSATLFLSSAATGDELVHAVATFGYFPVESAGC